MNRDTFFIKKTFELAKKAEGNVSPNPLVGAIIVKEGRIIGSGYHKRAGLAHAEIEAINKVKESLENSTLYVNLEPCCHWGRTPPCVDRIISSHIKRVVISTLDPNPLVCGRSVRKLKEAGIEVKVGVLRREAIKLNEVFFKNMKENRPFVVVKFAQSLDGKIATKLGVSKWITSLSSRNFSKKLRDKYNAVLVGVNTVIKDNPNLEGMNKSPYKIVLDPYLRIPLNCNLINKFKDKLIIFTSLKKQKTLSTLNKLGIKIFTLDLKEGYFRIKDILNILYQENITSVFVEGGSITIGRFFDEKLVDKLYIFLAPLIIGGKESLPSIGGRGINYLSEATKLKDLEVTKIGEDLLISGYPQFR
ncbi:MAG: bifunctional diaminohydroxyphosphoribosylaminopyrimidine deaminase/5-amino-6-(5-phosphoribosylamino)uracil reductase RibD [Candidatus Omnitrophica bacterium]|nr:bifunctional diaminohydroxyphosphoribosylaminopyrimidine deaminase/5-amino-6-(5-phosphoribosylamino)uracil reductase RibD [Candidatus Omnitrophota bacterium]MCM8826601.1 bifunctional diaminohydroxyphosphoribosylaminopyrimidine deaminase/5-amino-6-(5-phosphoribosylamino)uracil reductase RibD [Candidatus Omnitrophota bacterium]